MPDLVSIIANGSSNPWVYLPVAVVLGVLHGLEPGHSKTLMTAFIVAIRGTVGQAVLLGLMASISHTAVVWGVAIGGMKLLQGRDAAVTEPYFLMASAVIVVGIALWMLWRTWRDQVQQHRPHHGHARHDDEHHHHHHHDDHHHHHPHDDDDHGHAHDLATHGLDTHTDAHARAHAADIRRRFSDRVVTNRQIALFGLMGGLVPCPAAITVLLLCLQLKQITLGAALVASFSIGLAITLVTVGMLAALSVQHASRRWSWFGDLARHAPYVSSLLILAVGLYMGLHGWMRLMA